MRTIKRKLLTILRLFKKLLIDQDFRTRSIYTKARKSNPLHKKMIFYEAYHGNSMTGNPYAVFNYVLNNSKYSDYKHVWAVTEEATIPEKYKSHPNITFVQYKSIDYVNHLAIAKYLINDTTFPYFFHKRDEQIYANIWHGTPLKTMGIDIKNKEITDHKNIQRNFLSTDLLVSPNIFTAETLLKSHDIYTIFNGHILDTGYPRVDLLFSANNEKIREQLRVPLHKKIILYAPTWRGEKNSKINREERITKDVEAIREEIGKEYVILIKAHYYVDPLLTKKTNGIIHVPNHLDTNELLHITDILITDYSSIFFEFLPTKRPIIYYVYDAEEYVSERGVYLELEDLPGPLCYNVLDVINTINQIENIHTTYKQQYDQFLNEFCYNDDGKATARFIDVLLHNQPSAQLISTRTKKIPILMYGGGFLNNGITSSVINLLNTIDYEAYDVTLINHGTKKNVEKQKNIQKINKHVNFIYRAGNWNATLIELFRHVLFIRKGIYSRFMKRIAPTHLYKNELKRTIGLSKFDIGIDFSGYSPFWAALFAFGDFKKKSIYLHSDMKQEVVKKVDNKFPHKKNLHVVFSLYNCFDNVLSVSKLTNEQNINYLKKSVKNYSKKMDYVINTIDYNHILSLKDDYQYEFAMETDFLQRKTLSYPLPNKQNTNFITIGRLGPEKDHEKLLNAFSHIAKRFNNTKLYIVGDGALKATLLEQVGDLNLESHVIFTGQLNNPYTLLHTCDCFVLSSNHEGQPVVLLEALILGKPIIATDIPGSRSVIGNESGLIVENTMYGLIDGMSQFINGDISNKPFDYTTYREKAIQMFYEKVCQLPDPYN